MRSLMLLGLVAMVGCGASQAAVVEPVAPSADLQSSQLPRSAMPDAFSVTLSGFPDAGVNGTYNARYDVSAASGHLYLGERILSGPPGHVMVRVIVSHSGLGPSGTAAIGSQRQYGAGITLPSAQAGSASLGGGRTISASPAP